MLIYIIGLLTTILILYFSKKCNNNRIKLVLEWFSVVPFFVISAIRYDVGTDFLWRYTSDFENIANGIDVKNFEIGFKILIKICLLFSREAQFMFVVTSLIINTLIMWIIIKNSKNVYISLLIYFCGGFFFLSMNAVRQFIAMSLVLFGYKYIFEKKHIYKYLLCVFLAFLMHSSAIIMVILVFLDNRKLLKPTIVVPLSVIILIFGNYFFDILGKILSVTRFNVYFIGRFARSDISWMFVLYNMIIYAFMYLVGQQNDKENKLFEKENNLYYNIQIFALITTCMGSIHVLFSRVASYFMVFQIISIPYFIERVKFSEIKFNNKLFNNIIFKNKALYNKIFNKRNLYLTIIIIYILLLFYTNVINNDNKVLPYKIFINKNLLLK